MSNTYTLIKNGLVIDGTGSEPTQCDVLVHGPRIVHVGTDAATHLPADAAHSEIDASGCRVLPGLIDSHCHISFDQPNSNDELFFHRRYGLAALVAGVNAQKVLRAGFTSFFDADCVFDVGVDLRDAIEGGVIEGPRMTTGGNVLINCVGGTATRLLPDEGTRGYARIVHTPDEIVREIHKQIKTGVDWIKVHVSGLPIRPGKEPGEISTWTLDELKLVCDTAHQFGIPVVGHCRNAASTRDAALAGFDMILHATYMDDEALKVVVDRKVPLVPTFTFQANLADYGPAIGSDEGLREVFRAEITDSVGSLRAAYDAGVPLLTGSESGFSLTPYGDWHYRELQVFVEDLGMTPLQAINSATEQGARALKREGELGCIKSGYLADLLIFDGEPEKVITQLGDQHRFRHIMKDGKLVDLTSPLPKNWALPGWRVSEYSERVLTRELVDSMGLAR
ncbi:MAG: amidohydrolase family protein [Halieaceae bacterium]|jgi:imidazolonepropionase-like amidohydrolase|nr:amidohydrolase family protein [Halieaceae bacterium]